MLTRTQSADLPLDIAHRCFPFVQHAPNITVDALVHTTSVLATLRNLRRGHGPQGHLQRIAVPLINEPSTTYPAPERLNNISHDIKTRPAPIHNSPLATNQEINQHNTPHHKSPFQPLRTTSAFLTPDWDELLPLPTTWKVRFDGFGWSDYGGGGGGRETLPLLKPPDTEMMDDMAPFYEEPGCLSSLHRSEYPSSTLRKRGGEKGEKDMWRMEGMEGMEMEGPPTPPEEDHDHDHGHGHGHGGISWASSGRGCSL